MLVSILHTFPTHVVTVYSVIYAKYWLRRNIPIVSGHPPFEADSLEQLVEKVVHEELPLPRVKGKFVFTELTLPRVKVTLIS